MLPTVPLVILLITALYTPIHTGNLGKPVCHSVFKTQVYGHLSTIEPEEVGMHCVKPNGVYYFTTQKDNA